MDIGREGLIGSNLFRARSIGPPKSLQLTEALAASRRTALKRPEARLRRASQTEQYTWRQAKDPQTEMIL